jgi:pimeloyl-ACP methyl ester carboxylesterase
MSGPVAPGPTPFTVSRPGFELSGEATGEGPTIVLVHGLTATRRYVVHGSRHLPRAGFRTLAYDARGHGESDPAPPAAGYTYGELADDLAAILDAQAEGRPCVLAGHSMGAHTLTTLALRDPERVAAAVIIGPTYTGEPTSATSAAYWDRLGDGLERGGVDGFVAAYDHDLDPQWRDTLLRITRDRLGRHRHPDAVAQALREVPRSAPFGRLEELESLAVPALVVASHDESDPGHPYAVAEAWSECLGDARLISEEPGESPLAWQGGKLSRAIARFCDEERVRTRLDG